MRSVALHAIIYWQYFLRCSVFHGWCNFCPFRISRWQVPFLCHEVILQGPLQLGLSFPQEGSVVAPVTFFKTRSPTWKSLCLTLELQCLAMRSQYRASLYSTASLTSFTSSSCRCMASPFLFSSQLSTLQLVSPTSTGITTSLPYASQNGVSPVGVLAVFLYANSTLGNSSGHIPFFPSRQVLMILSRDQFVTSTYLLA